MPRFILKIMMLSLFLTLAGCEGNNIKLQPLKGGDVILAYGDSLTYGIGTSRDYSYPAQLARLIPYKVINAGQPGEETGESITRISGELKEYRPALVIICLGGNDMLRKKPYEDIKENLKYLIYLIRQSGAQVAILAVPKPTVGASMPGFYQEIGQELHVPVDDTTLMRLLRDPDTKSDVVHLNQKGYEELAQAVVGDLRKWGAID